MIIERSKALNPDLHLNLVKEFVIPEMVKVQLSFGLDFVIAANDSLTPKITFLRLAYESILSVVSSMGAGAKLDPTKLQVVDISKSYNCPFTQQVWKKLKNHQTRKGIKVVFLLKIQSIRV